MRSPRFSPARLLAGVGVWLACAGPALAQGAPGFQVDSWEAFLRLTGEWRDEMRADPFSSIDQEERVLREDLGLRLRGTYYHRRFLEYDLRGQFGLEQRDEESSTGRSSFDSDSDNLAYDLSVQLFRDLAYSGELYAHRSEARTRQTFFETTEAIVSESGASVNANEWWIPSRLRLSHYSYDGRGLDDFEETRDRLALSGNRFGDHGQLQYAVELADVRQGNPALEFEDLNVFLTSTILLEDEDRWVNSGRWRSQTGDLENEDSGFTSSYHHRFTDDLKSTTDLQYTRSESGALVTETYGLTTGLDHQLYESLATSGALRTSRSEFDDGRIDRNGGLLDLQYTKSVPGGSLRVNAFQDLYVQDEQSGQGLVFVSDEAHLNVVGVAIFLNNRGVDVATIVVTDVSGLTVYTAGVDYVVSVQSGQVRMDIPPGSLIAPDQTVLVDYAFFPNPDLRFRNHSWGLDFGLRLWDLVDISVGRTWVDQERLSGFDTGFLEDSVRTRADVSVSRRRGTVGIGYENLEADFVPYERTRLYASYDGKPRGALGWRLGATTTRTRYPGLADDERGNSASGSLFYRLTQDSSLDFRAEWREVQLRADEGSGYLLEARMARHFRALNMSLAARYSDEEFEIASDQELAEIVVTVQRTF